jgi:hypothetical protein
MARAHGVPVASIFDCSTAIENQAFAGMEEGYTPRAGVHLITPRRKTILGNEN